MKPHTVRHSGGSWTSVGYDERVGAHIWPIEEYLARRNHGPNVAARLKRLNANGKPEGELPRGWDPSRKFRYEGRRRP